MVCSSGHASLVCRPVFVKLSIELAVIVLAIPHGHLKLDHRDGRSNMDYDSGDDLFITQNMFRDVVL